MKWKKFKKKTTTNIKQNITENIDELSINRGTTMQKSLAENKFFLEVDVVKWSTTHVHLKFYENQ